jgi:hypothetical protein
MTTKRVSKSTLRVGVSKREINPHKPMFLVGYPHVPRTSTGIHDPLFASAFYLSNGKQEILLIALDILYISAATTRRCREAIQKACGIPAECILISATHTHSGPVTVDFLMWEEDPVVPPVDPDYLEFFVRQIVSVGITAKEEATPAQLAIARTEVSGVGGNRLANGGTMDHEVGLFYARRAADARPIGLAMIYGMHPTVMHEDSKLVSSDFPGFARLQIEEDLPGITVVYHNGPCGNLSPRYDVTGQTFAEAERLGRRLGTAAVAAIRSLDDQAFQDRVSLDAQQALVNLPERRFPSVEEAEAGLVKAREQYERLKREGAGHGPVRTAECAVFGAEEAVTLAKAQASGRVQKLLDAYLPVEVQVLRIGETFLVGLPCEIFVEYGLDLKQRASGQAFVISMANGELQGYIVTPEAEVAGGYEAAFSMFRSDGGRIMLDAAVELMQNMDIRPPRKKR